MDWTKAKSLLIVALLLTNIMLISVYFLQYNRNDIREDNVTKNTVSLLKSKEIYVETEIPDQKKRMPVLSVERSESDQELPQELMYKQEGMSRENREMQDYIKYVENFLKSCALYDDYTKLIGTETGEQGEVVLTFGTVFEGFSVEKSWMTCTVSDGRVTDVQWKWYQPIKFGETKKEIMTATNALIKFMSQIEEGAKEEGDDGHEPIVIGKIELIYWLDEYNLGEGISLSGDTAFPAWKVTYNEDQVSYIAAYEQ